MVRFVTKRVLILAFLAVPLFGGNEKTYTYLALGDSIAFGYNPTLFPPYQPTVPTPDKFVGYPESVAASLHLLQSKKEVSAACPGETSGSFLDVLAPDNGCHPNASTVGFKASIGLHTNYDGSQMDFAVSELLNNKHINLVTLSIGGNDLLLLEQRCTVNDQLSVLCVQADLDPNNPKGTLAIYAANLAQILTKIRFVANYHGTLIVMNSYSPSPDPTFLEAIKALNDVMAGVGLNFGVKFADGFTAFKNASAPSPFNGDPCRAGLLIFLSPTLGCDVHPSPLGRNLLAGTVLSVL